MSGKSVGPHPPENYLAYVEEQIVWHDKKATMSKRIYRYANFLSILLSAVISFLAIISSNFSYLRQTITIITASLATIVTITNSYVFSSKHNSLFLLYRRTSENLKREVVVYRDKIGKYSGGTAEDNIAIFAKNCNTILKSTVENWESFFVKSDGGHVSV